MNKNNMFAYLVPKSSVIFEEEIKKSRFITYLQRTTGIAEAKAFFIIIPLLIEVLIIQKIAQKSTALSFHLLNNHNTNTSHIS